MPLTDGVSSTSTVCPYPTQTQPSHARLVVLQTPYGAFRQSHFNFFVHGLIHSLGFFQQGFSPVLGYNFFYGLAATLCDISRANAYLAAL